MFALSATTMGTWEGIVLLFGTAFFNGGYLGSFIGIWLVFIGTLCSTATMAGKLVESDLSRVPYLTRTRDVVDGAHGRWSISLGCNASSKELEEAAELYRCVVDSHQLAIFCGWFSLRVCTNDSRYG